MGQTQGRPQHQYDGPLFGGHYPSDFSVRKHQAVDTNKALPAIPDSRQVRFGAAPPAWEFHRNAPTWDNTANTRYCGSGSIPK